MTLLISGSETAAFVQEHLDSAGTVHLPDDDITLEAPLTMDGIRHLHGEGPEHTKLTYTGTGAALKVNTGQGVTTEFTVEGLTLDGNSQGEYGLQLGQGSTSPMAASGVVRDVVTTGFTKAGALLTAAQIVDFYDFRSENNSGDGLYADAAAANTTCRFFGGRFKSNDGRGVYVEDARQFSWFGTVFESNGQEGLSAARQDASQIKNLSLVNCHLEANNDGRSGSGHAQVKLLGFDATKPVEAVEIIGGNYGTAGSGNLHISQKWAEAHAWFPTFASPDDQYGEVLGGTETLLFWMAQHLPTATVDTGVGFVGYRQSVNELLIYTNASGAVSPAFRANKNRVLSTSDLECNTADAGLILKSADGTRYRITVANDGTVTSTAV